MATSCVHPGNLDNFSGGKSDPDLPSRVAGKMDPDYEFRSRPGLDCHMACDLIGFKLYFWRDILFCYPEMALESPVFCNLASCRGGHNQPVGVLDRSETDGESNWRVVDCSRRFWGFYSLV